MFDLKNKIVLVVGGRGYLGRDFCQALRTCNATVIAADLPAKSKAASKSDFKDEFNDIDQLEEEAIFADTSNIIKEALVKSHAVNSSKYHIAKTAFEIALKQLV